MTFPSDTFAQTIPSCCNSDFYDWLRFSQLPFRMVDHLIWLLFACLHLEMEVILTSSRVQNKWSGGRINQFCFQENGWRDSCRWFQCMQFHGSIRLLSVPKFCEKRSSSTFSSSSSWFLFHVPNLLFSTHRRRPDDVSRWWWVDEAGCSRKTEYNEIHPIGSGKHLFSLDSLVPHSDHLLLSGRQIASCVFTSSV